MRQSVWGWVWGGGTRNGGRECSTVGGYAHWWGGAVSGGRACLMVLGMTARCFPCETGDPHVVLLSEECV
eukprot:3238270-Prymnesium_polylepis.1